MCAASEEDLESLLRSFDLIHQEYRDGMKELQLLKSSCVAETQRREALEMTCKSLKADNEHLMKMYTESLAKITSQLEHVSESQKLRKEVKEAKAEQLRREDENKKTLELLTRQHDMTIRALEKEIRILRESNEELVRDIVTYKTQINFLNRSLEQAKDDMELKYHSEIQDLRDSLISEQEEKKELNKKLQDAENELLGCKIEMQEWRQESISSLHVNSLKQKIMKLRKENEVLKRQLEVPELKDS